MKKFATLALIGAITVAGSAFAQDAKTIEENKKDVAESAKAIAKDDAAIAKQKGNLAENRASKAVNKATDDHAGQAVDSVKIGANKTAIEAKKLEKKVDEKILEHDLSKDNGAAKK